jgi:hypothetical protein
LGQLNIQSLDSGGQVRGEAQLAELLLLAPKLLAEVLLDLLQVLLVLLQVQGAAGRGLGLARSGNMAVILLPRRCPVQLPGWLHRSYI